MKNKVTFLKVFKSRDYNNAVEAWRQSALYEILHIGHLDFGFLDGGVHNYRIDELIETTDNTFRVMGEDSQIFVITDANGVPLYYLHRDGIREIWEEVKMEVKVNPVEISNELKNIEKWIGSAYQTDDEVDLALKAIRKIIGV